MTSAYSTVPPRLRDQTVERTSLLERLLRARDSSLVVISGGPGFGKTTLLLQWRQALVRHGTAVAWLSLRQAGRDGPSFLRALRLALEAFLDAAPRGSDAERKGALAADTWQSLVSDLAGAHAPVCLMLDDFQHAQDPSILDLVQALADLDLPGFQLAIAMRGMLQLRLGRLRASGALLEISATDLRFDIQEIRALLSQDQAVGQGSGLARRLHAWTQGWPAGLQLSRIALQADGTLLPGGQASGGALAEYLSEEVFAGLSRDRLRCFAKLASLGHFCADLAAAVVAGEPVQAGIDEMVSCGLLALPAGSNAGRAWYETPAMLGPHLAAVAGLTGIDICEVHRDAADWYRRNGMHAEALRHALRAEDLRAVVPILSQVPTMDRVGDVGAYLRWLQALPERRLLRRPRLCWLAAWAYVLAGDPGRAQASFELVRTEPLHRMKDLLLQAMISFQQDDFENAGAALAAMRGCASGGNAAGWLATSMRLWLHAAQGEFGQAQALYRESAVRSRVGDASEFRLLVDAAAASASLLRGDLMEAERIASAALHQSEARYGFRSISASLSALCLAECRLGSGRAADARALLSGRAQHMLSSCCAEVAWRAAIVHARLALEAGTPRDALACLGGAEQQLRHRGMGRGRCLLMAEKARIALLFGDTALAQGILSDLEHLADAVAADELRGAEIRARAALTGARVSLALGAAKAGLAYLESVEAYIKRFGRLEIAVTAALLKGLAYDALGQASRASESFHAAVALGYRLGCQLAFLSEGTRVQELLLTYSCGLDHVLAGFVRAMMSGGPEVKTVAPDNEAGAPGASGGTPPETLTPRELEIVALVEQAMSNKRIATSLNLSIHTVKWNLKRIFVKLGVSCRYEAIIASRRLGLLESRR